MKDDCSRINEDFFSSKSDVTDVDADLVDRTMLIVYTTIVSNVCKKHVKNEILHRCLCADMNKRMQKIYERITFRSKFRAR